jgi:hypothetical protein
MKEGEDLQLQSVRGDDYMHTNDVLAVMSYNSETFQAIRNFVEDRIDDFRGVQSVIAGLRGAIGHGENEEKAKANATELLARSIDKRSGKICRGFTDLSPMELKVFPEKIQVIMTALDDLANQINEQQESLLKLDKHAMEDTDRISRVACRMLCLVTHHENGSFAGEYREGTPESMVLGHIGSIKELAETRPFVNGLVNMRASIIQAKGPMAEKEEIGRVEDDMIFTDALYDAVNNLRGVSSKKLNA